MTYGYPDERKCRQRKRQMEIREQERKRAKGCLTGLIAYAIAVTAALLVVILIYKDKVRAEAEPAGAVTGEAEMDTAMDDADLLEKVIDEAESGQNLDDWNLILVNKWNPAPEGYELELAYAEQGYQVDARIAEDLKDMLEDARAEGLRPRICSAYRSHEKQIQLYDKKVQEYLNKGFSLEETEEEAGKWVAVPGTSEHETGLAVDLVSSGYQLLDERQEETRDQKWLMENCYKYGFILRYPNDKSELTGIYYEPWHYRYVGKEAAKQIQELGICFEEYWEMLDSK